MKFGVLQLSGNFNYGVWSSIGYFNTARSCPYKFLLNPPVKNGIVRDIMYCIIYGVVYKCFL